MKQMNEQQLNKGNVLHINRQSTDKGKTKSDTKIRSMRMEETTRTITKHSSLM